MAIPSVNLFGLRNQQFGSDGAFVFFACHRLVKFSFGFLINLRIGEDFQAEQSSIPLIPMLEPALAVICQQWPGAPML